MARMSLDDARAMVARLETEESKLISEITKDPRWLTLPLAKRDEIGRRHFAFQRYHALDRPSVTDAEECASAAGMKTRNFYKLYKEWASGGCSPMAIVPYKGLRGDRKSKLSDPKTADEIQSLIDQVLDADPLAAPRKVIKYVKENWTNSTKLPSDVTLRNFHDKAVRERKPLPGSLTINFSDGPQEEAVQSSAFGEVIVIDHTAPSRILVNEAVVTTPTLTLAIDLWSGLPLGFATSDGPPGTKAVLDALWDAQKRVEALIVTEKTVKPKILYASTFERQWDNFRNWLLKHDYELLERRDVRLHHGGPTKRIIGGKLGEIFLQPRAAGRRLDATATIDDEKIALLSLEQFHEVVDVTINRLLHEEFTAFGTGVGAWLDLPPRPEVVIDLGDMVVIKNRAPRIKVDDIINRVRLVLGDQFVSSDVVEKDDERSEYRIEVQVKDMREKLSSWLDLAAEALSIREEYGIAVQFDVTNDSEAGIKTNDPTFSSTSQKEGKTHEST